jgi:hypothetical protein
MSVPVNSFFLLDTRSVLPYSGYMEKKIFSYDMNFTYGFGGRRDQIPRLSRRVIGALC